mmetsp:Transcript_8880/g.23939  ORF Transcript_8880/g.23939 Transcript_8880/m.23939 type:complete len:97 (+) Transcript_8880:321-611(+)
MTSLYNLVWQGAPSGCLSSTSIFNQSIKPRCFACRLKRPAICTPKQMPFTNSMKEHLQETPTRAVLNTCAQGLGPSMSGCRAEQHSASAGSPRASS